MKALTVAAVITLSWLSTAHSQFLTAFGAKAGVATTSQNFNYTEFENSTERRTGFDLGAYAEVVRLGKLSFLAELHYIQKGMVETLAFTGNDSPDGLGTLDLDNRVDYLSVPVLAKLKLSDSSLHPYLLAGPRVDFLLSYKSELSQYDLVYDDFKKVDFGGDIGLGAEYDMAGPLTFMLETRYSHSFSDSYHTDLLTVKNNSFELLLGVAF